MRPETRFEDALKAAAAGGVVFALTLATAWMNLPSTATFWEFCTNLQQPMIPLTAFGSGVLAGGLWYVAARHGLKGAGDLIVGSAVTVVFSLLAAGFLVALYMPMGH